jgi:hypothetical protein
MISTPSVLLTVMVGAVAARAGSPRENKMRAPKSLPCTKVLFCDLAHAVLTGRHSCKCCWGMHTRLACVFRAGWDSNSTRPSVQNDGIGFG